MTVEKLGRPVLSQSLCQTITTLISKKHFKTSVITRLDVMKRPPFILFPYVIEPHVVTSEQHTFDIFRAFGKHTN